MGSTVTFIKTFNPALCRQKRIYVQLKDCTQMVLSHWSFSDQSLLLFLYSLFWRFFLESVGWWASKTVAYTGFSRGGRGGSGNLRIMKTRRKNSLRRTNPFSCSKLGEIKKKGLHQKKKKKKKKEKVFAQILSVCVLKLSAQVTKGILITKLGTRYLKSSGAAAILAKKQRRCRLSLLK